MGKSNNGRIDKYTPMDKVGVDPNEVLTEEDRREIQDILTGTDVKREDDDIDAQIARNNKLIAQIDARTVQNKPKTDAPFLQRIGSWVRESVRDNSWVLTIALIVLILGETAILMERPSYWWGVPVVVIILTIVALIWSNARFIIKAVISILVLLVEIALCFISGTSLTTEIDGGTMWSILMLTGWILGLTATYFIPIQHSRWTSIGFASIIGFILGYTLMSYGVLACGIGAAVSTTIAAALFAWDPVQAFMLRKRGPRMTILNDEQMNTLGTAMTSVNSAYKQAVLTWRHGEQPVYHGTGLPVYIFVPITVNGKVRVSKRRGTMVNGVRLSLWAQRVLIHMYNAIRNPFPVVCFLDMNGTLTGDVEKPVILDAPMVDTTGNMHAAIIGMNNGRRSMQNRVRMLTTMFSGARVATEKDEARIVKRVQTRTVDNASGSAQ